MSTPNCSDFVTRAEYNALLARLDKLLFEIQLVQLDLTGHKSLDVPDAHNYTPEYEVITELNDNVLTTTVVIESESRSDSIEFPNAEVPSVTCDIFDSGDGGHVIKVGVNGEFDEDTLYIEELPLDFVITEQRDNQYQFDLTLGEQQKTQTLTVTIPEQTEENTSNLTLDADYNENNNVLTITVADKESSATARVFIEVIANNNPGGGGNVSCENLSQEFQDCCAQILAAIATNLEKIQQVEQYVTIDVSSTVCSDYKCEFPKDESDQPLLTYAEATFTEKVFEGKGIAGLNERLKYLATNQDAIYKEICKAIDPITKIYREDLYQFCDNSDINRNDYPDTSEGTEQYNAAVDIYLAELVAQSKYGHLLNAAGEEENGVILSAPASYINGILADFALIQGRNNNQALCAIAEREPTDVVSVVASPEVVTNVSGKVLTLHFVTLDNYPKRKAGSYPRPIHIPGAKEEYDWETDFKDLRFIQGDQYGELTLEGYRKKVSGWFESVAAGNAYFDAVLKLTTATEKNRNFPQHSNPRTDIVVQSTRPHRAFIESVNAQGRAICHAVYRPLI